MVSAVAFRSEGYVPKAVARRVPNYFQSEKDSAILSTVREVCACISKSLGCNWSSLYTLKPFAVFNEGSIVVFD